MSACAFCAPRKWNLSSVGVMCCCVVTLWRCFGQLSFHAFADNMLKECPSLKNRLRRSRLFSWCKWRRQTAANTRRLTWADIFRYLYLFIYFSGRYKGNSAAPCFSRLFDQNGFFYGFIISRCLFLWHMHGGNALNPHFARARLNMFSRGYVNICKRNQLTKLLSALQRLELISNPLWVK